MKRKNRVEDLKFLVLLNGKNFDVDDEFLGRFMNAVGEKLDCFAVTERGELVVLGEHQEYAYVQGMRGEKIEVDFYNHRRKPHESKT